MVPLRLLQAGIIQRCESPWAARYRFVEKSSGALRLVHNYIPLNSATIKSNYSARRIEPILRTMGQAFLKYMFAADGVHGYWAVPISRADQFKTAFVSSRSVLLPADGPGAHGESRDICLEQSQSRSQSRRSQMSAPIT